MLAVITSQPFSGPATPSFSSAFPYFISLASVGFFAAALISSSKILASKRYKAGALRFVIYAGIGIVLMDVAIVGFSPSIIGLNALLLFVFAVMDAMTTAYVVGYRKARSLLPFANKERATTVVQPKAGSGSKASTTPKRAGAGTASNRKPAPRGSTKGQRRKAQRRARAVTTRRAA